MIFLNSSLSFLLPLLFDGFSDAVLADSSVQSYNDLQLLNLALKMPVCSIKKSTPLLFY